MSTTLFPKQKNPPQIHQYNHSYYLIKKIQNLNVVIKKVQKLNFYVILQNNGDFLSKHKHFLLKQNNSLIFSYLNSDSFDLEKVSIRVKNIAHQIYSNLTVLKSNIQHESQSFCYSYFPIHMEKGKSFDQIRGYLAEDITKLDEILKFIKNQIPIKKEKE